MVQNPSPGFARPSKEEGALSDGARFVRDGPTHGGGVGRGHRSEQPEKDPNARHHSVWTEMLVRAFHEARQCARGIASPALCLSHGRVYGLAGTSLADETSLQL